MIKLLKFTAPCHYDIWPEGTFWQDGDNLYIQVSKLPEAAHWIPIGKFLEASLSHLIHDDKFIENCMKLYHHTSERPHIEILDIS